MTDQEIFQAGSTTYYWSSKFFPRGIRDDVFKLYSFVRVVDDYVDLPMPDIEQFNYIEKRWKAIRHQLDNPKRVDDSVNERVLMNIAYIVHRYGCGPSWVDAFLASMRMDIEKRTYHTMDDTLEYIYGSAEVIGLFMARILGLPSEADHGAQMLGRAMQYINFIRDIDEDLGLGRMYFPKDLLIRYGLKDLTQKEAETKPAEFREFMQGQVKLYQEWQAEAKKSFRFIPRRARIAIRTASDMYNWTGEVIYHNPHIVYEKKVKPSKPRVLRTGLKRGVYS